MVAVRQLKRLNEEDVGKLKGTLSDIEKWLPASDFALGMMKRKNSLTGKIEEYLMLAMASRDRSFFVRTSALKRPLFVIDDFFDRSVSDVTWSQDGKVLLAYSMDGSVAAVVLTANEIGKPFKVEEMRNITVKFGLLGAPDYKPYPVHFQVI